jgi:hypothetical protein
MSLDFPKANRAFDVDYARQLTAWLTFHSAAEARIVSDHIFYLTRIDIDTERKIRINFSLYSISIHVGRFSENQDVQSYYFVLDLDFEYRVKEFLVRSLTEQNCWRGPLGHLLSGFKT